ncbi:MAG: ATP-binding protein [Sulfurimonas sp.]|jgi:signal transduction histidine kinase/CheY-like chemotaxis protein/HAMP domain-containing protein
MTFSVKNKIFILFITVIITSLAIVGWYGFESAKNSYIDSALLINKSETVGLSNELKGILETVPNDVIYNSNLYALKNLLIWKDLDEEKKINDWLHIYTLSLKDYLLNKKLYYKIRFLDINGNEKIALNYDKKENKVIEIKEKDLQNQSNKEYFTESIKLKKDEIYISELNLNTEYGKVVEPHIAVLRYSTPFIDENGEIKGVLVVSLNAEYVLNVVASAKAMDVTKKFTKYYLLNELGDYLFIDDEAKRWGSQLGTTYNFKNDYKDVMDEFANKDEALFIKNHKIFSMNKIYPDKKNNKARFFYLVTELDEDVALSSLDAFVMMFFIILGITLFLGLLFVNRYISRLMNPLAKITLQLKALSSGEIQKEAIDYRANDEIGAIVKATTILIDAIETTINQANAVANGDFTKDILLLGKNDKLGLALIEMTKRLKEISILATSLSRGNYDVAIVAKGGGDELGLALIEMVKYLEQITTIAESIAHGNLDVRYKLKGSDDRLGIAVLEMIEYLKSILRQANAITKEDFTHTIQVKSKSDELGLAIVTMTDILRVNSVKNRDDIYFNEGVSAFNDAITDIADMSKLSKEAITTISRYVGAVSGAVYGYEQSKASLELGATFAMNEFNIQPHSFKVGEGVVGQVALEKIPMHLKNIQESDYKIETATTLMNAKEVYIFPLTYEEALFGVVEIMSLRELTKVDKEYFAKVATIFATALYTTAQNAQIKVLLEKSQQAFEELQVQSEELQESNVQMEEQQQQLTLQSRELQEKNSTLALAKQEIDKRAKDLEKASKYKSEFLANMSHELRTPLNSIILLSKLLSMNTDEKLDEESVKKVSVINKAGNDLLLLINDILDLTKIESGKMELVISELYSGDMIEDMRGLFGTLAEEKGVKFIINDNFKGVFMTDSMKLSQVLKNLLSNAFKFTKEGSVVLDISLRDENIMISVKDTGIGIQNDKINTIFDAFKQVDGSISREFGGTGLGLSISKTIVELLHGHIFVESAFGKGTTFTVVLPMAHEASEVKIPYAIKGEIHGSNHELISLVSDDSCLFSGDELSNKNILIVDDDSRNIFTLTSVLENLNAEVYSAFNGKEAIEILEKEKKIDIILMDIMMPVMDGLNAIRNIKSNEKYKNIPVIAITAKTMPQDKQDCLDAGASDYLPKPLEHGALISMVKAWIK